MDTVLILSIGLGFAAGMSLWIVWIVDPHSETLADVIAIPPFSVPLLYMVGYVILRVGRRHFRSLCCIIIKVKAFLSLGEMRRITEMDGISENTPLRQ